MNNILILGALPKDKAKEKLYESIVMISKQFAKEVSSPIDTAKFQGSEIERYKRALKKVGEADLIIGEQSEPSTGQGIEIREAEIQKKPLIIIAKTNSKVSGLVKGCSVLKEIIYYDNIKDLKEKLVVVLKK